MPSHLHKDASSIGGKPGINPLELRPPLPGAGISVAAIEVLILQGLCLLRGVRAVGAYLSGSDEVRGLPHLMLHHQ